MKIIVKNLLCIIEAEELMAEQPTLSYFFGQTSGNTWELKDIYRGRENEALEEVQRYFTFKFTVE